MLASEIVMKTNIGLNGYVEIRDSKPDGLFGKIQIDENLTFLFRETCQLINLYQLFQDYQNQIFSSFSLNEVSLRRVDDHNYDLFSGMIELRITDIQCQKIKKTLYEIVSKQEIMDNIRLISPDFATEKTIEEI